MQHCSSGASALGVFFFGPPVPPDDMVIAASIADEAQSRTEKFKHLYAELLDSLEASNSVEVLYLRWQASSLTAGLFGSDA